MTLRTSSFGLVVATAALLALAACSSDETSTGAESAASPPPAAGVSTEAPETGTGPMSGPEFEEFTALDADVVAQLESWAAARTDCTALGADGDLEGFRECITNAVTEARKSLTTAGSTAQALYAEVGEACLAAATAYSQALGQLAAATSLAQGFADSLDVQSMPLAFQSVAKARKAYAKASAGVRDACKPS